jgi:hypothetical protein
MQNTQSGGAMEYLQTQAPINFSNLALGFKDFMTAMFEFYAIKLYEKYYEGSQGYLKINWFKKFRR